MNRRILELAIPNIISNLTIPLLGMVDLALMGHLEDKIYIGAVAVGTMIFNFIYWGFSFLRMGTSGFTAQAYGNRDLPELVMIITRAITIAVMVGILLLLFQNPIAGLSFRLIDAGSRVEVLAREYFHIRILAAPATISLYALTGWFLGMQNARIPMVITIMVNILNIGFSFLFIKVFHMRADGVALGTVIAQYCGVAVALWFLIRYYSRLFRYWKNGRLFARNELLKFFMVNRDIFIRTLCLIFTLSFFTAQSARSGETTLAVNSLLMQFFMLFSFLADGYAHAAEALTGRFKGAGNYVNLTRSIKLLFLWAGSIALLFTVLYLLAGNYLILLLTSNKEVIRAATPYLPWVIAIPLIAFPAFIWDGIYIGATASVSMRNSMLISTALVFLPAYYLLENIMGNHGLWFAFIIFMASRGITLTMMAQKSIMKQDSI
ncbi:MAG: MATE family efflux transporter [Bacteroidales bacterium]